ncbi:MAG: hypothetical protein D6753_09020, partial [Planctomycetota bacterium]
ADALQHAHEQGVIHRDIKPANLILERDGRVWVTDFGLAKAAGDHDLTAEGDVLGTWRYMAPEQFDGEATPRSDVFSLGLTLYEMVTLRPAYESRSARFGPKGETRPRPPSEHIRAIPKDLETIVLKATELSPKLRYASAGELAEDLQRYLANRPIEARRVPTYERFARWCHRNPVVAGLSAVTAMLLIAIAVTSSVQAHRWHAEHSKAVGAAERATAAERKEHRALVQANRSLFAGYVTQARFEREKQDAGRRFNSLGAIVKARDLLSHMDLSLPEQARRRKLLRDEAIIALTLPDAQPDVMYPIPQGTRSHTWVGFDPDVERVAYQESDGGIVVRRLSDGLIVARFDGIADRKPARPYIVFSPDGKRLAVRGGNSGGRYEVCVWDIDTGECLLKRSCQGPYYHSDIAFSPDSSKLAFEPSRGKLELVDLEMRQSHAMGTVQPRGIYAMAFSPDGTRIAVVVSAPENYESPVHIFDLASSQVVARLTHPQFVSSVAWSPDSRQLAAACYNHHIYLWKTENPDEEPVQLSGHHDKVRHVTYDSTGDVLMSSSWDSTTRWWDPHRGRLLFTAATRGLQISRDGRWVGVEDPGKAAGRWRLALGTVCRTLMGHSPNSIVTDVAFDPSSSRLASASNVDGVQLWNLGPRPSAQRLYQSPCFSLAFLADDRLLLATDDGALAIRCDVVNETQPPQSAANPPTHLVADMETLLGHPTRAIATSLDRARVTLTTMDGFQLVYVRDASGRLARVGQWRAGDGISFTAMSPDGQWVAHAVKLHPEILVRNTVTSESTRLPIKGSARLAFSPDGRYLLVGGYDDTTAWQVGRWNQVFRVNRSKRGFANVAFTSSATEMAIADYRRVDLLRASDRTPFASLRVRDEEDLLCSFPEGAASLAFSHDDRWLAVGATHGTLRLWDLQALKAELESLGLGW